MNEIAHQIRHLLAEGKPLTAEVIAWEIIQSVEDVRAALPLVAKRVSCGRYVSR